MPSVASEKLAVFAAELLRWNRRINLTGVSTVDAFIEGPLFDALTVLPVMRDRPPSYVDVGSGGGLPGIPVVVAKEPVCAAFVEPRGRRATFLRHATHLLGLGVEVIEARDDTLKREWTDASAQAVFDPPTWLERGSHLVVQGGCVYVLAADPLQEAALPKGARVDAEFHCVRASGAVPRFAYRILMKEMPRF